MDSLFVNIVKLSTLMGLSHFSLLIYLRVIRFYIGRRTLMVEVKRHISYLSLAEIFNVAAPPGIQLTNKNPILRRLLADKAISVPNKADTIPTRYPDTNPIHKTIATAANFQPSSQNADISKTAKADIPHNSENNYVCVYSQFKKFKEISSDTKPKSGQIFFGGWKNA